MLRYAGVLFVIGVSLYGQNLVESLLLSKKITASGPTLLDPVPITPGNKDGGANDVLKENLRTFWWSSANSVNKLPPSFPLVPNVAENPVATGEQPRNPNPIEGLVNLIKFVYLNRDSSTRVQYFNANYNRNSSAGNESTPHAVFGSPLCMGMCLTKQIYWANSSIALNSGNKFNPPGAPMGPNSNETRKDNGYIFGVLPLPPRPPLPSIPSFGSLVG